MDKAFKEPEESSKHLLAAFNEILKNVPLSGIISVKNTYLSQRAIDKEISEIHDRIKLLRADPKYTQKITPENKRTIPQACNKNLHLTF